MSLYSEQNKDALRLPHPIVIDCDHYQLYPDPPPRKRLRLLVRNQKKSKYNTAEQEFQYRTAAWDTKSGMEYFLDALHHN